MDAKRLEELALQKYNPFLPQIKDNPYPGYSLYRTLDPVHWGTNARNDLPGCWYFFKAADILAVLKDSRLGRQRPDLSETGGAVQNSVTPGLNPGWLINLDPPEHTILRPLLRQSISPQVIEGAKPGIRQMVEELVSELETRERVDLVTGFAERLPVRVMADLLGVKAAQTGQFVELALQMLCSSKQNFRSAADRYVTIQRARAKLFAFFKELVAERKLNPGNDLTSNLLTAHYSGRQLTREEVVSNCLFMLVSGYETTVNLIGSTILTLLKNPGQLQQLKSNPGLVSNAIEEALRYESPLQMIDRWVQEDLVLNGHFLSRGERVYLVLGSANRDPELFPEPDVFDINRKISRHFAFGAGPHACLGAGLVRAEAEIATLSLLGYLARVKLDDSSIQWRGGPDFRGLKKLVVTNS